MFTYLVVDGSRKNREASAGMVFRVKMPAQEIRLISGFARPTDFGDSDDQRRLGVALTGMRWEQGEMVINVPVTAPGFIDGFHHVERDSDGEPYRWTNGDAALPPTVFPDWQGQTLLRLDLKFWRGSTTMMPVRPEVSVMNAFESLGDNCELALAQRHFGVEPPLGLLRWSGTNYADLLRGLENRFEGIGDPGTTEVVWNTTDYRLRTPYLSMHTTNIEQCDAAGIAEILRDGGMTLRLLRRKLLHDISKSQRIFVFRCADPSFCQAKMRRLHAALRKIGPASLLCVTLRQTGRPDRMVERLDDGLYAGYLDRFVIPDGPFGVWHDLCAQTLALHRGSGTRGSRP